MAPNACPPIINNLAFLTEKAALLWKIYQLILESSCLMCHLRYDFVQTYKTEKGAVMCERHVSKDRGQDDQFFLSNNCSYFT